ncbi:unnamed protein product [Dicrocoelium dendriticum]|nr:unnamed protein product [Dicrocoelium dendriticum]
MAKAFSFAQEISEYVNDLVDCFNEKMSKIEYLERRTVMLYRERFEKLAERRRLDMKDMAELATQPAGQPAPTNPEEKKLFEIRRKRCSERDARRVRRQRARESSNATASLQPPSSIGHLDGTSTDDEESQAVIAKRKADIDALLVDAGALFDDVVDDFCQLPLILHRFADWHCNFPETYTDEFSNLFFSSLWLDDSCFSQKFCINDAHLSAEFALTCVARCENMSIQSVTNCH